MDFLKALRGEHFTSIAEEVANIKCSISKSLITKEGARNKEEFLRSK
jgi:hypothetical protein